MNRLCHSGPGEKLALYIKVARIYHFFLLLTRSCSSLWLSQIKGLQLARGPMDHIKSVCPFYHTRAFVHVNYGASALGRPLFPDWMAERVNNCTYLAQTTNKLPKDPTVFYWNCKNSEVKLPEGSQRIKTRLSNMRWPVRYSYQPWISFCLSPFRDLHCRGPQHDHRNK